MATLTQSDTTSPAQSNGIDTSAPQISGNGATRGKSLGYFLIEAKYGSKLVVKQQLVETFDTDTFRTLVLRVLTNETLKQRGAELRLQVGFKLGSDLITIPSSDEVISVVLQRFPDIKSLQYTIQPFESEYIKIEPIRGVNTRRARLFQVLGWVVRIVGSYELLLLAIRLGLRLAGIGPSSGPDTEMVEAMAVAEALVEMNSEQLDEVKELYELGTEDFALFKQAIQDERRRRGMAPSSTTRSTAGGKGESSTGGGVQQSAEAKPGKPWVSSGEEDNEDLDGSFGRDAAADYDESAKK